MMFWSSVKTAAVVTAASVVVVGGGAIMAQQVAQREAVGNGEVILRAAEIPISVKDAKGEICVAVPKQYLDDGNRQMWSFDRGMTDFYRRVFHLTEKEQRQLQVLLEEAWSEADALERCFTVTQEGQSVTAELRDADAVQLLQEIELRIQTNFLHKVAGVLGPGRAEVMNWFTARRRDIVPWPFQVTSVRSSMALLRCRMKLSRESPSANGAILFKGVIDAEGVPNDTSPLSSAADSGTKSSGENVAKYHMGTGVCLTPWPALGARLGVSREAALEQSRADRARYTHQENAHGPFRETDSPLAPPPIGFVSQPTGDRGVYIAVSVATRNDPLFWFVGWSPSTSTVEPSVSADMPTNRYRVNPAWSQVLRLSESQSQLLAGIFHRTLAAMNDACAEGLTVTHKSDDKVVCVVRADALAKFPEILDRQHREVKTALGSEEKAEIVRTVVTTVEPLPGHAAELLWKLRTAGKEGARFEVEREKQSSSSGDVYYSAKISAGKFNWGGGRCSREHFPPFLTALLPAK